KIGCSLSPQVDALDFRPISFQARGPARKGNRFFDKRTQLLRFWQSRHDAILARINQRSREVSQHRDAVFCCSPQFPMGLKMTHDSYPRGTRLKRVIFTGETPVPPLPYCTASANSSFSSSPRSSTAPSPDPGIGLPCSSNCIPKSSPIPRRMSRISPRDFLPKFFVASISRSERCTRSRIVLMPAFFRQLYERTESSSSSTERSN